MSARVLSQSREWFSNLFGFTEQPEKVASMFDLTTDEDGNITMTSKQNHKSYSVGKFEIREYSSFNELDPTNDGTLNLLIGHNDDDCDADIITAETNPENHGATFMMASNFNALDHIPHCRPPQGLCSCYITRREQGAPGAVVCGPALIYRQYLTPVPGSDHVGQLDQDINLLWKTPAVLKDGYIRQLPTDKGFDWSDLTNYAIAVHSNIDATLGRYNVSGYRIVEGQRINQVFCSTLSFALVRETDENLEIAYSLLKAQYEMTIKAAWECSLKYPDRPGAKKVFLTLVGGGCFRNPIPLICRAIDDCSALIHRSGLQVFVVCYNPTIYAKVKPCLARAVESTGGKEIFL